jgi:hypothetical protein
VIIERGDIGQRRDRECTFVLSDRHDHRWFRQDLTKRTFNISMTIYYTMISGKMTTKKTGKLPMSWTAMLAHRQWVKSRKARHRMTYRPQRICCLSVSKQRLPVLYRCHRGAWVTGPNTVIDVHTIDPTSIHRVVPPAGPAFENYIKCRVSLQVPSYWVSAWDRSPEA